METVVLRESACGGDLSKTRVEDWFSLFNESQHETIFLSIAKTFVLNISSKFNILLVVTDVNSYPVELPPDPIGKCSNEMQQKIISLTEKMNRGFDMNLIIQRKKDFRNPSIYEKLIEFCDINEFGTNYTPQVYDPHKWNRSSYYDELAKVQKTEIDKREKERKDKDKAKVEVIMGTAKKASNGSVSIPGVDDERKKKSKWDQVGLPGSSGGPVTIRPPASAGFVTLTTSSTGTKSTVISAFGSFPKKPKP